MSGHLKITLLTVALLFTGLFDLFAHSRRFAYCYDCDGNLTIYIAHYHGCNETADVSYRLTVNGVATTYTSGGNAPNSVPHGTDNRSQLCNRSFGSLPMCGGDRRLVTSCTNDEEWHVFYHPNMPKGVPIEIQPVDGNNTISDFGGCNDMTRRVVFYIPTPPTVQGAGNLVHSRP